MEAKRQAKIYSRQRTPLENVIPLETPFSVEIDVSSLCNLRCNFCFQGDLDEIGRSGIELGLMTWDLFRKIVDDMREFPQKIKKIRLFEFGEPLLNRNLPGMIRYIWECGVAEYVEITTNGVLLTEDLNLQLIESGLSRINISVNATTEEKFRKITRRSIDMSRFVATLEHLYRHKNGCHIYIKLADDGSLTPKDEEEFYGMFGEICDEIYIERLSPIWRDTDINDNLGNAVGPYGQVLGYKRVCPLIFTRMIINHDGVVVACCVDWKRRYVLGDLSKESAYGIWNGDRLRDLQLAHLEGRREDVPLCKGCTALSSCTIDNIDPHAGALLERVACPERKR